jgi:hypothetical protein
MRRIILSLQQKRNLANATRVTRRLVAPVLAASLLVVSAGIVAADEPVAFYVLDVFNCSLSTDLGEPVESLVVPPGSEVYVFEGWIAKTRGQVQAFVNNVTWVLTVNGEPVDVTPYLSGVINLGPRWGDFFSFSAGTLDAGESLHTHYDNVLKAAVYDGFAHYPIGSISGGGVDCTVSASA